MPVMWPSAVHAGKRRSQVFEHPRALDSESCLSHPLGIGETYEIPRY
jgi:hypothetical protein